MTEHMMTNNEQDVQLIKEFLMQYPHWKNEAEVIARNMVAKRVGNLDAVEEEYEKEITDLNAKLEAKEEKIKELKGFNNSLVALLGEIRDMTCREIGIKIIEDEAETAYYSKKK